MQTITEQGAALTVTTGELDGIRDSDPAVAKLVYLDLRLHFGPGKYDYDCVGGWVHPNAAALLRAAPELLASLQACTALLARGEHPALSAKVSAAIANATGAA